MKQTCILILGMHRSGTSALSGTLNILDVYLGSDLIKPMDQNPKGFYENTLLNGLNENLLKKIGSSWDDVFYNDEKLDPEADTSELEEIIKKEFKYSQLFAIKDPRLAYLFPLYTKALTKLGIEIKIIIPFRNPLEVAGSLNKRNNFSQEKSLLLWAYHFLLSEKHSRDFPRVFTGFEELVESPQSVIKLIDLKLDLNLTKEFSAKKDQISEFLAPGLKHHNIALDNLSEHVPGIVRELVNLVPQLNNEDSYKLFDELYTQLFDFKTLFYNSDIRNSIQELDHARQGMQTKEQELAKTRQDLQARDKELQLKNQELVSVYTSRSWIATRPVRKFFKLFSSRKSDT